MKKMLCLLSLFVCCSSGIGVPHSIEIQPGQDWVEDDLTNAVDFWGNRGILFDPVTDIGTPEIGIVVDDVLGTTFNVAIAYWDGADAIGQIHLDTTLKTYKKGYQTCVLAHEMGHAIGMSHVQGHSLMSGEAQDVNETSCPWSKYDQEEFERAVLH